eukprot:3865213-Rhodomonas_salina.2
MCGTETGCRELATTINEGRYRPGGRVATVRRVRAASRPHAPGSTLPKLSTACRVALYPSSVPHTA